MGSYKVNTDGCVKDRYASGGGLSRIHKIYGLSPTLLWPFTARQSGGHWSIQATLRHIRHLLAFDRDTISHIYREDNQLTNLPQGIEIIIAVSSTTLRTFRNITVA
ncbi:Uncharacterized protein Adt_11283 [Abeliophyllum distichum]|uniref:Uncharacterized protein n=1 Tax=Abeliophyllum distichum TaxID=126358 RepID=A0ABD1UME0_9LAMI